MKLTRLSPKTRSPAPHSGFDRDILKPAAAKPNSGSFLVVAEERLVLGGRKEQDK